MKHLTQSYRDISLIVAVNADRFLVPLMIIAALTLSGWVLSYTPPF